MVRKLFRIKQEVEETLEDLGDKMTRLAELAFPNLEIRENGAIQALLADTFMDTIRDDDIRGDVLKGGPCRLTEALEVAKSSERTWERIRTNRDQGTQRTQGWKDTEKNSRNRIVNKKPHKDAKEEDWEAEADPNRK